MRSVTIHRLVPSVGALLTILLAGSCGGPAWINKDYRNRLDTRSEGVLLMPVVVHELPKDLAPYAESLVTAELARQFARVTTTALPLKDKLLPAGFGNLSWQIALGAYQRGKRNESPDIRGTYYDWLVDLPDKATRFLAWVKGALSDAGGVPSSSRIRYLMAVYVERRAWTQDPKHPKRMVVRVVGGIYDAQESRIVAAAGFKFTCQPDREHVRDALSGIGARFRKALRPVLP